MIDKTSLFLQGFQDTLEESFELIQESFEITSDGSLVEKTQEPVSKRREKVLERLNEAKFLYIRPSQVSRSSNNT